MLCKKCGASLSSEVAFCRECGAPVIPDNTSAVSHAQATQAKAKVQRRKRLLLVAGVVIAAVAIVLIIILSNQATEFELLADGSLYCSSPDEVITIPTEFDGKALSLNGNYRNCNFEYDGKLQHFLNFYRWLTNYEYRDSGRYIYCSDYTLYIAPAGGNGMEVYYPQEGGVQMVTVHFQVLDGNDIIRTFDNSGDLWDWVNNR